MKSEKNFGHKKKKASDSLKRNRKAVITPDMTWYKTAVLDNTNQFCRFNPIHLCRIMFQFGLLQYDEILAHFLLSACIIK